MLAINGKQDLLESQTEHDKHLRSPLGLSVKEEGGQGRHVVLLSSVQ